MGQNETGQFRSGTARDASTNLYYFDIANFRHLAETFYFNFRLHHTYIDYYFLGKTSFLAIDNVNEKLMKWPVLSSKTLI